MARATGRSATTRSARGRSGPGSKLGQILAERGLIDERGLQSGLAIQQQAGLRLGSALVRLGLLSFDTLAAVLSEQLGFPAADSRTLERLDARALAAIPLELRAKYQILPIRLDGRRLHLALVDPTREDLMNHLAAALRVEIAPYVLPQGLFLAHAQRAELLASGRAITGPLGIPVQHTASRPASQPGPGKTAPEANQPDELLDLVYLDEVISDVRASRPTTDLEIDISFEDSPKKDPAFALDQLVQRLDHATRADEVVATLLRPPLANMTLAVLLLPRGDIGSTLGAWGTELPQSEARTLVVPLNVPSLFKRSLSERRPTVGETKGDPIQAMVATFLRAPAAQVGCALPVLLGERIVNLLYLQSAQPIGEASLGELTSLVAHAARTYGRLLSARRSDATS